MSNDATRLMRPPRMEGSVRQATSIIPSGSSSSVGSKTAPLAGAKGLLPIEFYSGAPYRIECELAAGGMGIVYLAYDERLKRDVAIKVLNEDYLCNADAVQRFVEEAQIAGQLQHPCIPPIHEIGTLPDGRPFLAMKLIQGRTLAEILAEREKPSDTWPRDFAVFEQICQAIAYAHNRSVIHRDLKPANVMVGNFGEVQVMDWGLAKVLGERYDSESALLSETTCVQDPRASDKGADTIVGSMLGTPTFMPPEQARGEKSRIDERSDVFGLGAILCVILTGKPPYAGKTVDSVRRQAVGGEVADCLARLRNCGADPAWIALASECLDTDPGKRPHDASVVAGRVADLRLQAEERRRQAELEKARAEVHVREERKRRAIQGLLAMAVVLIAVLGCAGFWVVSQRWNEQEREARLHEAEMARRRDSARVSLEFAIRHADDLAARNLWNQARGVLERESVELANVDDPGLRSDLAGARQRLDHRAALDEIRIDKATWTGKDFARAAANPRYRSQFARMGFDFEKDSVSNLTPAIAESPIKAELLAALDDWSIDESQPEMADKVWKVAAGVSGEAWRAEPEVRSRNPGELAAWAERVSRGSLSASTYHLLGNLLLNARVDGTGVLERGVNLFPGDFWLHMTLAQYMSRAGEGPDRAMREYRAALAIRPDCYAAFINLGDMLHRAGEHVAAWECMHKAQDINPHAMQAYFNKGSILASQGKFEESLPWFRKVLEIEPTNTGARLRLGQYLLNIGRTAGADELEKAMELEPESPQAYGALGDWLAREKRYPEALTYLEKAVGLGGDNATERLTLTRVLRETGRHAEALALLEESRGLFPRIPAFHNWTGTILRDNLRRPADAVPHFQRSVELSPREAGLRHNLSLALTDLQRFQEAIEQLREAARLEPDNPAYLERLACVHLEKAEYPAALEAALKALEKAPAHPVFLMTVADCLDANQRLPEALGYYREAVKRYGGQKPRPRSGLIPPQADPKAALPILDELRQILPDYAAVHYEAGRSRMDLRQWAEAVPCLATAAGKEPNNPFFRFFLGIALRNAGRPVEALDCFASIQGYNGGMPGDFKLQKGETLARLGRFDEAVLVLEQAVRDNKSVADAFAWLTWTRFQMGDYAAALQSCDKAIELQSDSGYHFNYMGLILRNLGRFEEALEAHRKAVALRPDFRVYVTERERTARMQRFFAKLSSYRAGAWRPATSAEWNDLAELLQSPVNKAYGEAFDATRAALRDAPMSAFFLAQRAAAAIQFAAGKDKNRRPEPEEAAFAAERALFWCRCVLDTIPAASEPCDAETRRERCSLLARGIRDPLLAPARDPAWLVSLEPGVKTGWESLWKDWNFRYAEYSGLPAP